MLALDLCGHLGVECVVERRGQRAERSGQNHRLLGDDLGLRLSLVDVHDLPGLGEALGGGDQPPQSGCQDGRGGPVGSLAFHHRGSIWIRATKNKLQPLGRHFSSTEEASNCVGSLKMIVTSGIIRDD